MPVFAQDSENNSTSNQKSIQSSISSTPRSRQTLGFVDISTGLPTRYRFNFIVSGDFNKDGDSDLIFSAETRDSGSKGLYAYTGNGGSSWTNASNGLTRTDTWSGIALGDADDDGYTEFYAANHGWNGSKNLGVRVWEFRNGIWNNSGTHVSTPFSTGRPYNVFLANVTGSNRSDLVVCNNQGIKYFQNNGGNPATWQENSTGLKTNGMFTALTVADMNKDGLNDILACDYSSNEYMYIQQTTGNRWQNYWNGVNISGGYLNIEAGDVNNDSHMDIIYGGTGGGIKCLLGNSGGGDGKTFSWTPANSNLPSGNYYKIEVIDIDADGDLDLVAPRYINNNNGEIRIYLGNGSTNPGMNMGWSLATNINITSRADWIGAECADLNGDGSFDIAAVSYDDGVRAWLNNISLDITPPGTVNDLNITNITTNSITVNWTAPADNGTSVLSGPVKSYDIRYSTGIINPGNWANAIECSGEPTPATPNTEQSYKINGLLPGTLYYIGLRANDERPNLSPLSNIVFNTTYGIPDLTKPGQIRDLQALNPTNNSINLTWTAPADNGTNTSSGPVYNYEIKYYSSSITNATWNLATSVPNSIIPSTPGSTEVFEVSKLQPETIYYFSLKARDEGNNTAWVSNSAFNTTLPDPDLIPPLAINDLNATKPTNNSINLTWTSVGDDGNFGNASVYDIRYSTNLITDLNWVLATQCSNEPIPQSVGTNEEYQVTGLNSLTTYYFAINVGDEKPLWSGLSNIAFNTTLTSEDLVPPSGITDLVTSQATENSIKLTWTAPGDDNNIGTVAGYEIRYNTEHITEVLWNLSLLCPNYPTPVTSGVLQEFNVTGLLSTTKYYFAVKAFDERPNFAPISNIANGTTLTSNDNSAPNSITDLEASALSSNSIRLTWTAPGDDGSIGTVTGYDIRFASVNIDDSNWLIINQVDNEPIPQVSGTEEELIVTGIFSATKYFFAIKAYDERPNYSQLSNIANATTYWSLDGTEPNRINDLEVLESTNSTITLTWTAPGDDGSNGTATVYNIRYATTMITTTTWSSAINVSDPSIPKPAGEKEIFLVTGLESNTKYYFAIKTADERPNWSPISNSPFGITLGISKPEFKIKLLPEKTKINSTESIELLIEVLTLSDSQTLESVSLNISSNHAGVSIDPPTGISDQDGILTTIITAPEVFNITQIEIFVQAIKVGFEVNSSQITITIFPDNSQVTRFFNLKINDVKIVSKNETIREGDNISVLVNITNSGEITSSGFTVEFYINNELKISKKDNPGLNVNIFSLIEFHWTSILGNHTIKIIIVPSNIALESNSIDNTIEKPITVLNKIIDTGGDGDGDGDGDDEKKSKTESSGFDQWVIILLLAFIVVIFVISIVIFKRKKEDEFLDVEDNIEDAKLEQDIQLTLTQEPQPITSSESIDGGYIGVTDGETDKKEYENGSMDIGDGVDASMEVEKSDRDLDVTSDAYLPDVSEEESTEQEQIVDAEPEPINIVSEIEKEPGLDKSDDEELVMGNDEDENNDIGGESEVPCPICQNNIPFYTNPCPNCGSELSWE